MNQTITIGEFIIFGLIALVAIIGYAFIKTIIETPKSK